jgi:L-ribulose-5-phosphate 4-epimerase
MSSLSEVREEFIAICRRAFHLGMQVSTGGNISARLDRETFLVKPTGMSLYNLEERDLLITDQSGVVLEGEGSPTKEFNSHLAVYKARDDLGAIVHYHPAYATAFAVLGKEIPLQAVHAARILKKVPVVPPAKEGSEDLAKSLVEVFAHADVRSALLAGHGIVAVGNDLREAENIAELVEETAKIAFLSSQMEAK